METLQQIFLTVIAGFVFFILIAKIASAVTNGDEDDHQSRRTRDFSKVLAEELNSKMEKSSRKMKSMKKVRFAVDHDETLVNKVVAGPSETKQVVFVENNHEEEIISLNDVGSVVKSAEEEFVGVENSASGDNKSRAESVSPSVVDYDQTKQGNTETVDQKSSEGTMNPYENAAIGINDQMSSKLLSDDGSVKNGGEEMISLNDVRSVVKSPEEESVGVEHSDSDDNKSNAESVTPGVVDYDQTKEGNTELLEQKSNQCPVVQNAATDNKHQMCIKFVCDDGIDESEKEKEGLISEEEDSDDDWEGIERSDLEKVFAMAADYGKEDDRLTSDIQMQLYGLHKVATEGPCHEPQPMALKLSARSKWNAWQKLGSMDPDVAMEQYITLLSEKVPEWSQGIYSLGADLSNSRPPPNPFPPPSEPVSPPSPPAKPPLEPPKLP
ncbi:hypothetical protein LXL04_008013 [Taraxacum kok-saghyz]